MSLTPVICCVSVPVTSLNAVLPPRVEASMVAPVVTVVEESTRAIVRAGVVP